VREKWFVTGGEEGPEPRVCTVSMNFNSLSEEESFTFSIA
jgi:hypothetical protein